MSRPHRSLRVLCLALATMVAGCGSAPRTEQPVDTRDARIAQASDSAYEAFTAGMHEQAANLYGRALERARLVDDRAAVVDAAYNRAFCRYLIDDFDGADRDLVEALAANALADPFGPTAGILLLRAEIARTRGDADAAEALIDRALNDNHASPTAAQRDRAALLRGELALDREDVAAADSALRQVPNERSATLAYRALRARIADARGEPDAGIAYDNVALLARSNARYRQMARALDNAGRHYDKHGAANVAADRYYAAARSFLALDDRDSAIELARRAADAAERSDNADLQAATADLVRQLTADP